MPIKPKPMKDKCKSCTYSRAMDQPYPRLCVYCGHTEEQSVSIAETPSFPISKIRFDFNANTIEEAKEYIYNRAIQLLPHGVRLICMVPYKDKAVTALFLTKDKTPYQSIYILKDYRNQGLFKKIASKTGLPIITSNECNLIDYLINHEYEFLPLYINTSAEYKIAVQEFGNTITKRSGQFYMNHIDEGLAILNWIGASDKAKRAYIIHPIYQGDTDLAKMYFFDTDYNLNSWVLINAMEYRSVANEYLSTREVNHINDIRLSPLKDVNDMLIADKIQNRKDFELYHEATHPRSKELKQYFQNWLTRLGVSEEIYLEYKKKLTVTRLGATADAKLEHNRRILERWEREAQRND